jgi:hypothetical protein
MSRRKSHDNDGECVFIGALIGAALGIGSAIIGGKAQSKAANTIAGASNSAAAMMDQQYQQTRTDLAPYRASGEAANSAAAAMLGLNPGSTAAGREAANAPDLQAYLQANPDVARAFQQQMANPKGAELLAREGVRTLEDFARLHYQRYGQAEGRQMPTVGQAQAAAQPPTTGSGIPTTGSGVPTTEGSGGGGSSLEQLFNLIPGSRESADYALQQVQQRQVGTGVSGGGAAKELMDRALLIGPDLRNNELSLLMNMSGQGQGAATSTGQFGANATANSASAMMNAADARASSYANNPWAEGLGVASGYALGGGLDGAVKGVGDWLNSRKKTGSSSTITPGAYVSKYKPQPYGAAKLMGAY